MENRPPQQETPRRPPTNSGRKTNGSGGSPTPPWLWLLLLGGFALIFWQFVPKTEIPVVYYPWFYEQVENDNIKSISIQGTRFGASCARRRPYQEPGDADRGQGQEIHHLSPDRRRSSRSCKS